jgi:hypothetical protein
MVSFCRLPPQNNTIRLIDLGCTRLAAASDKVYQLLAHGRWFSPGIPASSTTKTGRHDIAEILLKVALKHQKFKINQSCSIVSRRKTAKTNHRMKPYSKSLQNGCLYSISQN